MAMNNPYPWVSTAVAAANGYNSGGVVDAANAGFDPTNPGRRKQRPVASAASGGIPATPPVVAAPQAPVKPQTPPPWTPPLQILAKNFVRNQQPQRDQSGAMIDPFGNKIMSQADAERAVGIPAAPPSVSAASAAGTSASDAGGIPATPPAVQPASPATSAAAGQNRTATANGQTFNWNTTPDRLVGLGAAPTVSPNALVDQGVTLPDGRKLPYGAMVNGVPTFSDGSGGIGDRPPSIPRTMTQSDIAGLGARLNTVPSTAFTAAPPAFNSDNSDANIAAILRSQQGGKFGITPEMNAQATTAAIANRDPRSTLGRAALNLQRNAAGATTVLQRKAALEGLSGIDTAAGRNLLSPAALAQVNAEGQNALARANLGGQFDLAGIRERNAGQLDNTELAGKYGIAEALARPNAAVFAQAEKLNTNAIKLLPQILGLDPAGQITDPVTKKQRLPTQAEIAQGIQIAKQTLDPGSTAAPPTSQAGASAASARPTFEQVRAAALQQNPNLTDTQIRTYYNSKYGS